VFNTSGTNVMKVREKKGFGFILDAIDLIPQTKPNKWVRVLDAVIAFLIVWVYASFIYNVIEWLRK
jgi:hypothetical protein